MVGRFEVTMLALVTTGLVLAPAGAVRAQEVGGRFRVLIPPFQPMQNADDGFGKDAAKKLRQLVNTLATHQPVSENEMKDALKRVKLKEKDLDCTKTRQLASQMNAQVALCASYHNQPGNREVVDATFYGVGSQESFKVEQRTFPKNKPDSAATYIFNAFDTYVQQLSATRFCNEYAASRDFQSAMEQCDKAIKLNPDAIGARYTRADVLFQENKYDEAMQELKRVLQQDPNHENALQLAGYISTKQGNDSTARRYYQSYLDLNPSDVHVRMNIAFQLDTAGDPAGAMQLIEVGLKVDSTNTDLLTQYAGFAFNAALTLENESSGKDSARVSAEVTQYFQKAVNAGQKVFQAKGKETPVVLLRNTILALDRLHESDKAVQLAQQAVQTHGGESQIWSAYADALHTSGQLDDAITALDSVRKLDPSDRTASLRQGQWLVDAGRLDEAVRVLKTTAASGHRPADEAAQILYGDAITNGVRKEKYDYAAKWFEAATTLPNLSAGMQQQLTFWQAYSIYQAAVAEQKPQKLTTARSTLPRFEQVLELLKHVGDYPSTINFHLQQMRDNLDTYIDIQKAIIKRGS